MTDIGQLHASALAALNRREWRMAAELSARLLASAPKHAQTHCIAGIANMEMRNLASALQHLQAAVAIEPERADFAAHLAMGFSMARQTQRARAAADRSRALSPRDSMTLNILGKVYEETNDHAAAADVFRQAVDADPHNAHHHYNLAVSLIATGQVDAAEAAISQCLTLDPQFWKAHLALAHLRRQSAQENHVQRLLSLLEEHGRRHDAAVCLHMALAKEYEDLARYAESFHHLSLGKAAGRLDIHYTSQQDEAIFCALRRALPAETNSAAGEPNSEPIFVFGMPRSGTTLVDRILSSHPDVRSIGESQNFGIALRRFWGSNTPLWLDPDIAKRTRHIDWRKVGETYVADTKPSSDCSARFIDKLPHNFLYAGFIANALPNAKMICLRRDPVDTCLSNFRQLFAEKLPYYHYSFDLLDTGKYYLLFDQLMAHWQRVIPGRVLEVSYEDLVEQQESTTRRLLDFCDLDWNRACLTPEYNTATVGTASSLQVREPVYKTAVQRWKNYQPQLTDLLDLLEHSGIKISR